MVHIGGLISPETVAIRDLCRASGAVLRRGRRARPWRRPSMASSAGSFGAAAAFSFYPTKVMTSGEGGMIVTSDVATSRRRPDLPRSGQGRIPRRRARAARLRVAHERAARRRRSRPAPTARRVHRDPRAPPRRRLRRRVELGAGAQAGVHVRSPVPAGCKTNYYKYVVMLGAGRRSRRVQADAPRGTRGVVERRGLRGAAAPSSGVLRSRARRARRSSEAVCARQVCLPIHSDMTSDEAGPRRRRRAAVLAHVRCTADG